MKNIINPRRPGVLQADQRISPCLWLRACNEKSDYLFKALGSIFPLNSPPRSLAKDCPCPCDNASLHEIPRLDLRYPVGGPREDHIARKDGEPRLDVRHQTIHLHNGGAKTTNNMYCGTTGNAISNWPSKTGLSLRIYRQDRGGQDCEENILITFTKFY